MLLCVRPSKQHCLYLYFLLPCLCNGFYLTQSVVYLSAAQDILKDRQLPAGIVLIADIAPALVAKYTMTRVMGSIRSRRIVMTACLLTAVSILVVVTSGQSVMRCLFGVALASFSSGLGESTFLTMTTTASDGKSVVGWASGTGAAGLVGSVMYYVCTVVLGVSPSMTLLMAICLPIFMWSSFLRIEQLHKAPDTVECDTLPTLTQLTRPTLPTSELNRSVYALFIPLFLIYYCEYTVNMGVVPLVARGNRRVYVGCQAVYQMGVFTSRTLSMTVFPGGLNTAILALLQAANLLISLILLNYNQSALMAAVMAAEGLIGGAGYVMTFSKARQLDDADRVVSRVSMADCLGILMAGLTACLIDRSFTS